MLNENVKKLLAESMWDMATCAGNEPNVVPVAFKDVTEDGKLVVGDVFLETTLNNLKANGGRIAISVYDAKSLEGYQIKGVADYVLIHLRLWWKKCSVARLLPREHWLLRRKRLSCLPLEQTIRKFCKADKNVAGAES